MRGPPCGQQLHRVASWYFVISFKYVFLISCEKGDKYSTRRAVTTGVTIAWKLFSDSLVEGSADVLALKTLLSERITDVHYGNCGDLFRVFLEI